MIFGTTVTTTTTETTAAPPQTGTRPRPPLSNTHMRTATLLVVLLLALNVDVVGQQSLQRGQRVRITAPTLGLNRHIAIFRTLDADTLVVDNDNTVRYPLSSLARLETSIGRRSHPWRGAWIGLLSGVGLGFLVWQVGDLGCYEGASTTNCAVVLGGGLGGAIGAVSGVIVGSFIKTDRWATVPLDHLRVSLRPQQDSFAVGARIGFSVHLTGSRLARGR